jgi:hypothetical protein
MVGEFLYPLYVYHSIYPDIYPTLNANFRLNMWKIDSSHLCIVSNSFRCKQANDFRVNARA